MLRFVAIAALMMTAAPAAFATAAAEQAVGQPAGNFKLIDASGRDVQLSDYRGKTVVLEWHNPGCPFVKKHYESGNMQTTQAQARAGGAVWLTINSGAPGKQGHMTGPEAQSFVTSAKAVPTSYLLDPRGVVGKGYGAKTTPQIYVIDPTGKLAYNGAIDDKPTADKADIATARNHALAALAEVKAGKPVSVAETRPYGCSVKYAE